MTQYLELNRRIVEKGVWVENERTGKRCKTVINATMTYDVAPVNAHWTPLGKVIGSRPLPSLLAISGVTTVRLSFGRLVVGHGMPTPTLTKAG